MFQCLQGVSFLRSLFSICPLVAMLVLLFLAPFSTACGRAAARREARQERRSGSCSSCGDAASCSSCNATQATLAAPAASEYVDKAWLAEKFPHVLKEAELAGAIKKMPLAGAQLVNGQCVGPNCPVNR